MKKKNNKCFQYLFEIITKINNNLDNNVQFRFSLITPEGRKELENKGKNKWVITFTRKMYKFNFN